MTSTTATAKRRQQLADMFVGLLDTDVTGCDRDELASLNERALQVRGWLDAFDIKVARRTATLAEQGHAEAAPTLLAGNGRRGKRDAEAAADRAAVCAQMPGLSDALESGTVSAGHVDAIASAARSLDDAGKQELAGCTESLVNAAATMSPEAFDREVKDLAKALSGDDGVSRQESLRRQRTVQRWVDKHTGMHKTLIVLDPVADAAMWTAINSAIGTARSAKQDDNLTFDQLRADAVVDLITSAGADCDRGERVPEVSVLIDFTTLRDGYHERSIAETSDGIPLPISTIRRLCCEAKILPIVLGSSGEVLDLGREVRLANRAQRRALRALYRTCGHPDCTVAFDQCRVHHVIFFELGGATDLANLIPLCELHHHLVHEGGWSLSLAPDRTATWTRPDGTVWRTSTPNRSASRVTAPRRADLAKLAEDLESMLREAASTNRAPP